MKKLFLPFIGILLAGALFVSTGCKKDNNSNPQYTVPTTYSFSNVDSQKAKITLSMIAQIEAQMNSGNTAGTVVSNATLKSMYANTGGFFTDTTIGGVKLSLNNAGFSLKNFTSSTAAQTLVESIMDSINAASKSGAPASNGVAGVSSRKTLLSANGIYWRQYFTKTAMGIIIGHLIQDVYLGDSLKNAATNAAKQHAWDQAFFLWGVPANFPANRAGVKYWGSYTSQIDSGIAKPVIALTGINSNPTLMNAFLKGRAALANNDNATALQQAAIIIPLFEKMEAAAAIHELNEAKMNLSGGAAAVCGYMSESFGFWTGLKFNTHKKIGDADYNAVVALYGTNFYNTTPAGIDAIINKISSIYGWDSIKSNL